jgi:hypothetical protein
MFGCRRQRERKRHGRSRRDDAGATDPQRTEDIIAYVESHLGITDAQRQAWNDLADAVRDSSDALKTARGAVDDGSRGALQRFAGFETLTETASAAVRRLRPPLEALYRVLDEGQRRLLDDLVAHGPAQPYAAQG